MLKVWATRNLKEFDRGKCYIQYVGENSLEHLYGQRTSWTSSSSAKSSLGGLEKLNMSQQCLVHSELH